MPYRCIKVEAKLFPQFGVYTFLCLIETNVSISAVRLKSSNRICLAKYQKQKPDPHPLTLTLTQSNACPATKTSCLPLQ
jgi:hypothetical protein